MKGFEEIRQDVVDLRIKFMMQQDFPDYHKGLIVLLMLGLPMEDVVKMTDLSPVELNNFYKYYMKASSIWLNSLISHYDPLYGAQKPFKPSIYSTQPRALKGQPAPPDYDLKINELDLRVRTKKILNYLGIKTVADLFKLDKKKLREVRTCGPVAIKDVQLEMKHLGLREMPKRGKTA